MRAWLAQKLQIKPGEGFITSLMFLYIFGVLSFYYILRPLRYGLFLEKNTSGDLPIVYILTAIVAGPLATLVFKLNRRVSAITLLTATNTMIIGTLFYFRWAMGHEIRYLPYVYYVYVQIVSVLSTAQFWLLAGYVYDNRQAKRIYGLLGAGAIAGAMAGSSVQAFVKRLSTESLLLVAIGVCVILIVLSLVAWRYRRPAAELGTAGRRFEEPQERLADLFRLIFGSRHLVLMALLILLTLIASQTADWQFNDALDQKFKDFPKQERKMAITRFNAQLSLITNILGITLQVTLTGFVLRRFGIGAAILFLPVGLFGASFGVLLVPTLWSTALALGSNNVFRYSINRAGLELLYLPLSPEVRKKLKFFLDVFVDRFGRAIAALIILAFTSGYFSLGARGTAVAVLFLTALSALVSLELRKTYVNSFRQQLARRQVDLADVTRYVTDPASIPLLVSALESTQERQLLYALRLLQSARGFDFAAQLLPLLGHTSAFVREEALRTLPALPGDYQAEAERMLSDTSESVRTAAVEYLCLREPAKTVERFRSLLDHENIDIRLSAVRCAAEHPDPLFRPSMDLIRSLLAIDGIRSDRARAIAARLAVRLPVSESVTLLRELLRDQRPVVVGAAARAAGTAGHLELLFEILPLLTRRNLRSAGREALVLFGPRITGTLGDVLADAQRDLSLRREIPWVLSQFQTARAADTLVERLRVVDPLLKYQVVKALNRLHERKADLPAPRPLIAERIYAETRAYYEALALYQSLETKPGEGVKSLIGRALRERLDQNLEIIFRLLGLQYPQKDIYFAYTALKGSRSDQRNSAIEFLDNLLQKNLKSIILPLLEESSTERLIDRASRLFGIRTKKREEALRLILQQPDVWLKACALHEVGSNRILELVDLCRILADDREPLIRETAEWALRRCA